MINIYVPTGYTANLSAASRCDHRQRRRDRERSRRRADAAAHRPGHGDDPDDRSPGDVCSPGTHAAIWNLNLSVAGQTLVLPLYVDPTSGAATALGAYQMRICLPPWDTPVGSPGRAFEGAQLLDAKFTVNNIFSGADERRSPSGTRCSRRTTPAWARRTPPPRSRRASLVGTPSLTLKATKKNGKYAVGGKLTEGGQARRRRERDRAPRQLGDEVDQGRQRDDGRRAARGRRPASSSARSPSSSRRRPRPPERDATATGCAYPLPATIAPGGCVSATLSALVGHQPRRRSSSRNASSGSGPALACRA